MTEVDGKALIEEMQAIKKLLILQLLAMGYKQKHVAAVLNVSDATLSRMLPKYVTKDLPRKRSNAMSSMVET